MYHPFKKSSSYLRDALYKEYKHNCSYCSQLIPQIRYMHVDHIVPTNMPQCIEDDVVAYISELEADGFIQDSIENYLPSCSACNIQKNNTVYTASNLRFYHEMARQHVSNILKLIDETKSGREYFFDPVDSSVWKQLDFKYQRGLEHAVMGYRLTDADVVACPLFPQVEHTEKQLRIVDYAVIMGETGCGKSISLFQTGYRFVQKGWQVYQLNNLNELTSVRLPENTENSLYLIDDAQVYSEQFINDVCRQARPNRKVLLAKTVSDRLDYEDIVLTNKDAVSVLFREYIKRKDEIWPIVKECDNSVGVNMMDIPIEQRLKSAKEAKTPWQFNYILRGGWKSMKDLYSSICGHGNCDLLAAAIAVFQLLKLDKPVNLTYINDAFEWCKLEYRWDKSDIDYLVQKRVVLSEDEVRIVHLQSAKVIASLFFDSENNEKQQALIRVIENEFGERRVSSLGMVWLCNGCNYSYNYHFCAEEIFITESIKESINMFLKSLSTSEEVRNMMYLMERIFFVTRNRGDNLYLFIQNENVIRNYVCEVDSTSASGFNALLNTIYNSDKTIHSSFCKKIDWCALIQRMQLEKEPDYYAWGGFLNRGLLLLGKKEYEKYSDPLYSLMEWVVKRANIYNIEQTTRFLCSVGFSNSDRIHDLIPLLLPVYKKYFTIDMKQAIHLFDFDFLGYICGIAFFGRKNKPTRRQLDTAQKIIAAIPVDRIAEIISDSDMQEWFSIGDTLGLILAYDVQKYKTIMSNVDLQRLSSSVRNSWGQSHEICMVVNFLHEADEALAKKFVEMNGKEVVCYYSMLIVADTDGAIRDNIERAVPLKLFTENWWDTSLEALKKLKNTNYQFTKEYLETNVSQIAKRYSNVTALDFTENDSLEMLRLIKRISPGAFAQIVSLIDKKNVIDKWDRCAGIDSRKKRWVSKRKEEYLQMLE